MGAFITRLLDTVDSVQRRHAWLSLPVAVARKMSNDQGGSLAALIAYYGFLSVFPLLLVFAAVLGFVLGGDAGLRDRVLQTTEETFPAMAGYIRSTIEGSNVAIGVGLVGALWAGLGVTRATERAMNNIWDIPLAQRPNLWWSRLRGLGMLCILGSTFLVSTALAGLRGVGGPLRVAADVVGVVGPLALNLALYLLAFQVLTNRHVAWRDLLPGAVVGAVGWTALQNLGAFYLRHQVAHASQLYGSLAAVVGLLAWIYLGAQLTLYAAELNVVLAERLWPRSLRGRAHTDADRRALARQAAEVRRTAGEVISVGFDAAHAPPGTEVPSGGVPSVGEAAPARGAATRDDVAAIAARMLELEEGLGRLARREDPVERGKLLDELLDEAHQVRAALDNLRSRQPGTSARQRV